MIKKWTGAYVAHECKKCGDLFIAEDYTKATMIPPKWRYCPKCSNEIGIIYENQTPKTNRTPEENKKIEEKLKKARSNIKNINSNTELIEC